MRVRMIIGLWSLFAMACVGADHMAMGHPSRTASDHSDRSVRLGVNEQLVLPAEQVGGYSISRDDAPATATVDAGLPTSTDRDSEAPFDVRVVPPPAQTVLVVIGLEPGSGVLHLALEDGSAREIPIDVGARTSVQESLASLGNLDGWPDVGRIGSQTAIREVRLKIGESLVIDGAVETYSIVGEESMTSEVQDGVLAVKGVAPGHASVVTFMADGTIVYFVVTVG